MKRLAWLVVFLAVVLIFYANSNASAVKKENKKLYNTFMAFCEANIELTDLYAELNKNAGEEGGIGYVVNRHNEIIRVLPVSIFYRMLIDLAGRSDNVNYRELIEELAIDNYYLRQIFEQLMAEVVQ